MTSRNSARRHRGTYRKPPRGLSTPRKPRDGAERCWHRLIYDFIVQAREYIPGAPFIYFIQGAEGGPIKIGSAIDPIARIAELQTGNAERLFIRYVIVAPPILEEHLHALFAKDRIGGEWFQASLDLAALAGGIESCQRAAMAYEEPAEDVLSHAAILIDKFAEKVT